MIKREKDDLIKEGAMKEKSWIGLNKRKKLLDFNIENVGKERKIIWKDKNKQNEEKKITFLFYSFKRLFICDIILFFPYIISNHSAFSFPHFVISLWFLFIYFLFLRFLFGCFFLLKHAAILIERHQIP